jgi:TrmH family RNA methyltransferase
MLSKNSIKYLTSLQQKKKRQEYGVYIVEGEKMVQEAIAWKNNSIEKVYCTTSFLDNNDLSAFQIEVITEQELKQISTLTTPNQALLVLKQPSELILKSPFYLVLDGIQDPGNLGTIIRLADWFGLNQIICSTDCVDCYNPKVVQASMGSLFRVQVHYQSLTEFIKQENMPVYGALLTGSNIYQNKLQQEGILIMGNEGNGIRSEILPLITNPLTIPRFGQAESLNVGIATAIMLSEFSRG